MSRTDFITLMIVWLINWNGRDRGRSWIYFVVFYQRIYGRTEKTHGKPQVSIVGSSVLGFCSVMSLYKGYNCGVHGLLYRNPCTTLCSSVEHMVPHRYCMLWDPVIMNLWKTSRYLHSYEYLLLLYGTYSCMGFGRKTGLHCMQFLTDCRP